MPVLQPKENGPRLIMPAKKIREKIKQYEEADPPIEYKFTLNNTWSRMLFVALLRRYEIRPYRYYRQRHNTVMARVSKGFVNKTLWPEFVELDRELHHTP